MDLKYANPFYGNAETDRFIQEGVASKWFYIKALCGNTIPHAVLPFGKMSVGAYSGGYPTGYGTHYPNSCCGIKKLSDQMLIRGFSHLHQSGVGGIRYYYNYAIATPFYGESEQRNRYYPLDREAASPALYEAKFNGIDCRLTVTKDLAVHQYRFEREGGRVAVDFSNDGLSKEFSAHFHGEVQKEYFAYEPDGKVRFEGIFSGVTLYFAAEVKGARVTLAKEEMCAYFDFEGNFAELRLSFSTVDYATAAAQLDREERPFGEIAKQGAEIWKKALSAIEIETKDEQLKEKFYSNFYHSIIKPVDMSGEQFLGLSGTVVCDLATLWDQYKTLLPMILLLYPEMGRKIADGIINISETFGRIPCSLGLSDQFPCEEQAKMLGIYTLMDAYYAGVTSGKQIDACIKRELAREDFKEFLEEGIFERYTHIIDTTDACLYAARITEDPILRERLLALSKHWRGAYDEDGLMSKASPYYEGDRYTYSFRPQANMEERIALAGGKENFARMLDDFFGFGKESLTQITARGAYKELEACAYHRFEGFNNECDMEAPYSYIFADRHDRLCEIVEACVRDSFGTGRSGLPGNNDSGGLSSCLIWNTLGIFPLSGSGLYLLGAPQVDDATVTLGNGNILRIEKEGGGLYVDRAEWNGSLITDYRISVFELRKGGTLKFYMKEEKE